MPPRSTLSEATPQTAGHLRRELSARNLLHAAPHAHEVTYGAVASVLYRQDEKGTHGNFVPASYRRIHANPEWATRFSKAYTASSRIAHGAERTRAELDCSNSSDALLMNIFCYPRVTQARGLCSLLGIEAGAQPAFGVRTRTPILSNVTGNDLQDRTEVDMRLDDLLVEAKLSETGFQTARADLLTRYQDFEIIFDADRLARTRGQFRNYQLLRGVLSAAHHSARFAVLCDARRPDLREEWFRTVACIHSSALRSSMMFLTWQEIAATLPRPLQTFLSAKYGIHAGTTRMEPDDSYSRMDL